MNKVKLEVEIKINGQRVHLAEFNLKEAVAHTLVDDICVQTEECSCCGTGWESCEKNKDQEA